MTTPKSKKPSPLITPNSPKITVWYQCKNCSVYLNQRDSSLHTCSDVSLMKYAFIKENTIFSFVESVSSIENNNINLNKLVLISLPAIQLCKFEIGQSVLITDLENKKPIVKTVWPTLSKSLLSVQVSNYVLQTELKMKNLDKIKITTLKEIPKPISELIVHSSSQTILNYDQESLLIALQSQFRNSVVFLNQQINVVFYGINIIFTIQCIVPFSQNINVSQRDGDSPSTQQSNCGQDLIDKKLKKLNLDEKNIEENNFEFFKVISNTKFIISNFKKKIVQTESFSIQDIGGLEPIIENMINIIKMSLGISDSIQGIKKSCGLLIHGTSGTGKTSLIHAVAQSIESNIIKIHVSDLFSKYYGEAELKLKQLFDKALDETPSIILIDNIDVLWNAKNKSDQERRVLACLISQIDRLHELQFNTIVLATCNSIDDIDVALRRPGRFDQEIELPIPTKDQRECIFHCLLKKINHCISDEHIKQIAFVTHGYVGADIDALIRNAATQAVLNSHDPNTPLLLEHLEKALINVKPSAMRQVLVEVPNVKWTDIGGQEDVKLKLRQSVEWPLKHPEAFERLGIAPPKGILMFGPPGCSKTMIAKALATESKLNFISVKGPELFRKYVGESEKCVRDIFTRARQVSPAVIFFDELDAMAGERGEGGTATGGSNVQERVLAQMLTEMDGIVPLNNVTIVAATNRPDRIDKALLRPGRLDRLVYVPLPDKETRRAIFNIRLKKTPLSDDINVDDLVEKTVNYSGAEIVALCDEAALTALENDLEAKTVTQKDLLCGLTKVTPRTPTNLINLYEKYIKK